MIVEIPYGKEKEKIQLPQERIIDILEPLAGEEVENLNEVIKESLQEPVGCPPLKELIKIDSKIVIIIDDITRPTPTRKILLPVLEVLEEKGVLPGNIRIIIALGKHRKMTRKEQEDLLGRDICERYIVENHEARNPDSLIDLGRTSFGTPVKLNKQVYQADLRILTGLIKPHNLAGYSGGGKSILPGVCGLETVNSNHGFRSTAHPRSGLGMIKGNPIREDIEEVLGLIGPSFIVNVVLDYRERICQVVAGDVIEAHRVGVRFLDRLVKREVSMPADICICGTPHPVDLSFYQMLNSVGAPYRLAKPIINPGGTIIVAGKAVEGISDGDFYEKLKNNDRRDLWNKLEQETLESEDRQALQVFLQGALNYKIVVVSESEHEQLFRDMGIDFFSDLQLAVEQVMKDYRNKENIIVMPYAPYLIPQLK